MSPKMTRTIAMALAIVLVFALVASMILPYISL